MDLASMVGEVFHPWHIWYERFLLRGYGDAPPRPLDLIFIPIYFTLDIPYGLCHASDAAFAWYPPHPHTIVNDNTVIGLEYLPDTIGWISIVIEMIWIPGVDQGKHPLIIEVSDCLSGVGLIGTLTIIVFFASVPPPSCSPYPSPYTPYHLPLC